MSSRAPHISFSAEQGIRDLRAAGKLRPLEERVGMSYDDIIDMLIPEVVRAMPRGAVENLRDQDFADEVMVAWGRTAESRLGQSLVIEDEMRAMSWQRRRHKRRDIVNRVIEYIGEPHA